MDIEKRKSFLKKIMTIDEFNDLNQENEVINESLKMYSEEYIDSVIVIAAKDKRFIINKNDISKLHNEWLKTLEEVSHEQSLINPVYVDIDENGTMLID
jgi:hypothetical protein